MTTKPTNPKDIIGADKLPLHLWPETATALGSLALLDGALKYGRTNWREAGVRASIYADAARRHLDAWFEGEGADPDSGLPHLGHALACLAILVDAGAAGKLTDDRMFPGGHRAFMDSLTPHVPRLKAKHAGKDPKHYTIADAPKPGLAWPNVEAPANDNKAAPKVAREHSACMSCHFHPTSVGTPFARQCSECRWPDPSKAPTAWAPKGSTR